MEVGGISVTFEFVIAVILFAIFVIEAYNKITTAISTHRTNAKIQREPINKINEHLSEHDKKIETEEREINELKAQVALAKARSDIEMEALLAIVRHDIDGNNINGLKDVREKMQNFLIVSQKPEGNTTKI